MKKRLFGSLLMGLVTVSVMAQVSNTLSPYTQFGLGALSDQLQSFQRGMGGLSYGLRDGKIANVQNPASYSAVDSLTMLFDLGVSGQMTNFKEGGKQINRSTADFDYAVGLFRVLPHVGVSFGVVPYSNIGYNYYESQTVGDASSGSYTNTYKGSGGFSQAFVGFGWELFKGFSVGANMSYLWGEYERTISSVFSDSYANTLQKTYSAEVNSWKLDAGAQVALNLGKSNRLTLGATAGIGHKLGADAVLSTVTTNTLLSSGSETVTADTVSNGLSIPFTFGGGFTLLHKNSLTMGADYQLQKWGDLEYPQVSESTKRYKLTRGILQDRHKLTVGVDWLPNPNVLARRSFFSRIHYRVGASYATPYYKIGTHDGPQEMSVSAGFGIPIFNSWNNRSTLNISAQWAHTSATTFVTENTFRINIGLTFNERWFAKWKVD